MKKILVSIVLASFMFIPNVFAKEKVQVYMFKGDGCSHCEDALKFFNSLADEDKAKFELHEYEVWHDEKNKALMEKVSESLGENVSSVPYIIIGEKTFRGFDEEIGEDILEYVTSMYESGEMIDKVKDIVVPKTNPIVVIFLLVSFAVIIGFLIWARKRSV